MPCLKNPAHGPLTRATMANYAVDLRLSSSVSVFAILLPRLSVLLLFFRLAGRRWAGGWGLLVVLLGVSLPARAQRVALDTNLRGLVIWQAVPDPAGWLWLATDRGGYRYDGQQRVPLRELVRQGPAPPAGSMRAVLRDASGPASRGRNHSPNPRRGALRVAQAGGAGQEPG